MSGLRLRLASIGALLFVFGFVAVSNFIPEETRKESGLLPDEGVRLGLDLQGGIHWVLGAQLEVAVEHELDFLRGFFESQIEDDEISGAEVRVDAEELRLILSTRNPADADRLRTMADDTGALRLIADEAGELTYALADVRVAEVRRQGMQQILEVYRRRIDDPVRGIPDSVIAPQGEDRVLVQIPGGQIDRTRARKLLAVTGLLEFKIVQDAASSEDLLRARYPDGLPENTEVAYERDGDSERVLNAYLVPSNAAITGEYLTDARVGFDRQQRPLVNFTWNRQGAELFSELTESNLRERLAIILDGNVYSAPQINDRIAARGQISGRFTSQEAADLAIVLRAGSLSVPTVIEEERTVGPALGADSIRRGIRASVVGLVLVVLFSVGYYRLSGLYASVALFANLVLILGVMSMATATLTLPGIAGLVLTVGMAVDANVIIFERIREELRSGKLPRAAVTTGFNKSLWTVLDANITTLITAIVLFEYGTGPIKGFAVTLSIGIITSVFAALVITRLMFAVYPGNRTVQTLSI